MADAQRRRAGPAECLLEHGTTLEERSLAEVGPAVAQDVEGDERDAAGRDRGAGTAGRTGRARWIGQVNAALELLKAGRLALVIERDDLPVEHQGLGALPGPLRERRRDLRELIRLFVAEPRPES